LRPVYRFAPSPNGFLHLGHALSALLNFDMARAAGGRLLLRIEDIDAARCRPQYEEAIYEDLIPNLTDLDRCLSRFGCRLM
jgi:glutamyl-Q tRNA(Asp) synthetase